MFGAKVAKKTFISFILIYFYIVLKTTNLLHLGNSVTMKEGKNKKSIKNSLKGSCLNA